MEDKIIATVNGEPITQQAVDFELQRLIHLYQQQGMPEQQLRLQLDAIRARALEQAIGTKLLIDEAKRLDIPVSGEELDAQFVMNKDLVRVSFRVQSIRCLLIIHGNVLLS